MSDHRAALVSMRPAASEFEIALEPGLKVTNYISKYTHKLFSSFHQPHSDPNSDAHRPHFKLKCHMDVEIRPWAHGCTGGGVTDMFRLLDSFHIVT